MKRQNYTDDQLNDDKKLYCECIRNGFEYNQEARISIIMEVLLDKGVYNPGGGWMWTNVVNEGANLSWVIDALRGCSATWVTDGSYNRNVDPGVSGAGWIFQAVRLFIRAVSQRWVVPR